MKKEQSQKAAFNLIRLPSGGLVLGLICLGLTWTARPILAQGTTVNVPFLADQFTVFNTDAPTSPYRQVNFVLPSGPSTYPDLTQITTPSLGSGGDPQVLNPTSDQVTQEQLSYSSATGEWISLAMSQNPDIKMCGNIIGAGSASITLNCTTAMYVMTAGNLKDELDSRIVTKFNISYLSYSDEELIVNYKIQGGAFDGKQVMLHGEMAYAMGMNPKNDPSTDEAWVGHMLMVLNWGADPLGDTNYLLIDMIFTAGASCGPASCISMSDTCNNFYGSSDVASYFNPAWQSLMAEIGTGQLYLSGAIPELLYLYDFSGDYSPIPAQTLPPNWLTYDTVLDPTNADNPGYTNVFQIANQYDAGLVYNLPIRFSAPGGNACGPTSLGMMLNVYGVNPVSPVNDFDNTTILGYNAPPEAKNGFTWGGRAWEWLLGQKAATGQKPFSAPSPLGQGSPVWESEATGDSPTDAALTALWQQIDALLYNNQPVEVRTDLSTGSSPGGGHCILLLGISFSPDIATLYGTSGNYYIAADPAGHYFANSTHYKTCETLTALNVGVNFGGWFAIYPKELLQQRVSDTSTSVPYNDRMEALTIGAPLAAPSAHATAHSPVALMITDPLGRQTGVMPDGTIVQNIPSSRYEWAAIDEEDAGVSSIDPYGPKRVEIDNPIDGMYQTQVTGTNSGTYELDWVPVNGSGAIISPATNSATTSVGKQDNYSFNLQLGGGPAIHFMSGANGLALFWPTNAVGFSLQTTSNLGGPNSWTTVSGPFAQTNGVYSITNLFSGPAQFYRLKN